MQTDLAFPQSLAEKYRPVRIADFIGLDRPKKVLTAFCKRPTSGAWLFLGPSGVGKSTMALALAAELQAELHKIPSQKCNAQTIRRYRAAMLVCASDSRRIPCSACR